MTLAPAITTAMTARRAPSVRVIASAIAVTNPLSSISLPNSAPSRKFGKNCIRKRDALLMKGLGPVGEQGLAREGGRG